MLSSKCKPPMAVHCWGRVVTLVGVGCPNTFYLEAPFTPLKDTLQIVSVKIINKQPQNTKTVTESL